MRKKIFFFTISLLYLLSMPSCGDNNNTVDAPPPVTELRAESGYGQVFLTWKIPDTAEFYYTKIMYKDPVTGILINQLVDHYEADETSRICKATVEGLMDKLNYEFLLTSHSYAGGISDAVLITAQSFEPAFNSTIKTVEVLPSYSSSTISWLNDTGVTLLAKVVYTLNENEIIKTFDASKSATIRISGLEKETTLNIYFEDIRQNKSEVKSHTITPKKGGKLDKSLWTIHSYSSSQPTEGNVNYFIDNNIDTYWHTRYHNASGAWDPAPYPHWIAVDLGEKAVVAEIELYPRQSNNDGSVEIQLFTSVDGQSWEDSGIYPFDSKLWGVGQSYKLKHTTPFIKYIKVVCTKGPGQADYSHLAELYAIGGIYNNLNK